MLLFEFDPSMPLVPASFALDLPLPLVPAFALDPTLSALQPCIVRQAGIAVGGGVKLLLRYASQCIVMLETMAK
jgi:hypothetical protein